jgi:hypothetical protein
VAGEDVGVEEREYGIFYARRNDLHRGPMTEAEARSWIEGFIDDGGRPGAFYVVSRVVGPWQELG